MRSCTYLSNIRPVLIILSLLPTFFATPSAFAGDGAGSGGGGDAATEMRIDEIRADILKWINEGGGMDLKLPADIMYSTYRSAMLSVLEPHAVVLGSVTAAEESATTDVELKVMVGNQPKTCRGFVSAKDQRPHILCNVERFAATPASDQYRLIHHEYAGLTMIERNDGASSDYVVSSQVTDYLVPETVLRLAVKKQTFIEPAQVESEKDMDIPEYGISAEMAAVKQSAGGPTSVEKKITYSIKDRTEDEWYQISGSIGSIGEKRIGGADVTVYNDLGRSKKYSFVAGIVSDTRERYSEAVKGRYGLRVRGGRGSVELTGNSGMFVDRSNGKDGAQITAEVRLHGQLSKRLSAAAGVEAGALVVSRNRPKTRTEMTTDANGNSAETTTLDMAGSRRVGVGSYARGKASVDLRLGKNWSVNAEAGAARTKYKIEDEYLEDATGNRRDVKNTEYRAGVGVTARF